MARCDKKRLPAVRSRVNSSLSSAEKGEVKFTGTPAEVRANEGELQKYLTV
jgi:hypothetical protein